MIRRLMTAIVIVLAVSVALSGCKLGTDSPLQSQPSSSVSSGATEKHVRGPQTIGNMTLQQLIYKAKQAVTVYVVDISDLDDGMKTALRCLQGLVAREEDAAIFLEDGDSDYSWRQYCASEYGVFFKSIGYNELFLQYTDLIEKIIIYDDSGYEFNTAFTMASVSNGICLDGETIRQLDADVLKGKETVDVRNLWASYDDAVNYAFENFADKCTPGYFSTVNTDTCLLDYLYAAKTFCVDLTQDASNIITRVSQTFPIDTFGLYFGSSSHEGLISSLSAEGFILVPADSLSNSTMLSSLPKLNTQMVQEVPNNSFSGQDKAFLSLTLINTSSLESTMNYRKIVQSPDFATLNLGVSVNPILLEMAHPIISWYYQNKPGGHEIISTVDGIGRVDWSVFKADYIDDLYEENNRLLTESGIKILPLSGNGETCSDFISGLEADCFFTSSDTKVCISESDSSASSGTNFVQDGTAASDNGQSSSSVQRHVSSESASDSTASESTQQNNLAVSISSISAISISEFKESLNQFLSSVAGNPAFAYINIDADIANDLFLNDIIDYISDIYDEYNNIVLLTPSGLYSEAYLEADA